MAQVSFYKINNSQLSSLAIKEGQIIFVQDTGKLYIDKDSSNRISVGGSSYSAGEGINISGTTISSKNSNIINGSTSGSLRMVNSTAESSSYTIGQSAFAEGNGTKAYGDSSHAEGYKTAARGPNSHAEGSFSETFGNTSHAEGKGTEAQGDNQHVQGKYNISDTTSAHIVGNGTVQKRSNAHTLDWEGNAWFAGDVYTGSTSGTNKDSGSKKLATEEFVTNLICINNAGFHNSIFRGKDVTAYYTDGTLYTRISSGTFEDLFVGDYIIKNNITWRIAGFDIHLNKGHQPLTIHHAVIVPDSNLTDGAMNSEGSTEGGYVGSLVYQNDLPTVLTDYITPVFGDHIIEYTALLTKGINPTGYNRTGANTGCSNSSDWYNRKLDLMDECEVYGCPIHSSSSEDCGLAYPQLPLFALAPQYIPNGEEYWLKDVSTATSYACVSGGGIAYALWTASLSGVRPRFLID